jgi:hypothetical protein
MYRKAFAATFAAFALMAAAPPTQSVAMASNDQQSNSASSSDEGNTPKAQRKICRNFEASGSHMRGKRLCMTQAQWREFYAAQEN